MLFLKVNSDPPQDTCDRFIKTPGCLQIKYDNKGRAQVPEEIILAKIWNNAALGPNFDGAQELIIRDSEEPALKLFTSAGALTHADNKALPFMA